MISWRKLNIYDMMNMYISVDSIEIFGYGSLLWKPDFPYTSKEYGFIKGFHRRFWQRNMTHRGTPDKPGRVATIIRTDTQQEVVWGVKYTITGPDNINVVMDKLNTREIILGSYTSFTTDFYGRHSNHPCTVLVFTATNDSPLYTGPSSDVLETDVLTIADEVVETSGSAGTNAEYVTKLADYIRTHIPEDDDPHLFHLDEIVRHKLNYISENRQMG